MPRRSAQVACNTGSRKQPKKQVISKFDIAFDKAKKISKRHKLSNEYFRKEDVDRNQTFFKAW